MRKPAYLAVCALVIMVVVIAAIIGHGSGVQNSQSNTQSPSQQPLMIDNSLLPSLQTQGSGLNPQPASTSSPGSTQLEGQNTNTTNPPPSPCNRCTPAAGHVCPYVSCPASIQ